VVRGEQGARKGWLISKNNEDQQSHLAGDANQVNGRFARPEAAFLSGHSASHWLLIRHQLISVQNFLIVMN
jgi:hypothetical protein